MRKGCAKIGQMANVPDFMEPGPLLSNEVVKQPIVSKATVQRCISKLSPCWTDEQLDQVVEMFQSTGCFEKASTLATLPLARGMPMQGKANSPRQ